MCLHVNMYVWVCVYVCIYVRRFSFTPFCPAHIPQQSQHHLHNTSIPYSYHPLSPAPNSIHTGSSHPPYPTTHPPPNPISIATHTLTPSSYHLHHQLENNSNFSILTFNIYFHRMWTVFSKPSYQTLGYELSKTFQLTFTRTITCIVVL